MNLAHQAINTRDTALFMSFRRTLNYRPNVMVPLVTLVKHFMGREIGQNGDIPVSYSRTGSAQRPVVVLTLPRAGGILVAAEWLPLIFHFILYYLILQH